MERRFPLIPPVQNPQTTSDLTFQNASFSAVWITQNYGQVTIENNRFFPTEHVAYGAPFDGPHNGVQMYLATGTGVTIRGNSFTGGDNGVSVNASDGYVIDGNAFTNQTEGAIIAGSNPVPSYAASGSVTNNVVNGCGADWCVAFFSAGDIVADGNTISIDISRRTRSALWISARTALVRNNTIVGTGVASGRTGESNYPISVAIGTFGDPSLPQPRGTFSGNHITGSWSAFWFDNSLSTVTDNVARTLYAVLGGWGPALGNAVTVNRNDFTDYEVALGGVFDGWSFDPTYSFSQAALQCNWWGSTAGPQNVLFFAPASYTPYATQPIANNSLVSCP